MSRRTRTTKLRPAQGGNMHEAVYPDTMLRGYIPDGDMSRMCQTTLDRVVRLDEMVPTEAEIAESNQETARKAKLIDNRWDELRALEISELKRQIAQANAEINRLDAERRSRREPIQQLKRWAADRNLHAEQCAWDRSIYLVDELARIALEIPDSMLHSMPWTEFRQLLEVRKLVPEHDRKPAPRSELSHARDAIKAMCDELVEGGFRALKDITLKDVGERLADELRKLKGDASPRQAPDKPPLPDIGGIEGTVFDKNAHSDGN